MMSEGYRYDNDEEIEYLLPTTTTTNKLIKVTKKANKKKKINKKVNKEKFSRKKIHVKKEILHQRNSRRW